MWRVPSQDAALTPQQRDWTWNWESVLPTATLHQRYQCVNRALHILPDYCRYAAESGLQDPEPRADGVELYIAPIPSPTTAPSTIMHPHEDSAGSTWLRSLFDLLQTSIQEASGYVFFAATS